MNSSNGHRKRIREKYLKNGINTFQDYEILELLLTYVIARKDTKELAKNLLKKFKTLEKIFKAKTEELKEVEGLGEISVNFLKLMGDLPEVLYENSLKKEDSISIKSKNDLLKFLRVKFAFSEIEKFFVLYLSSSNKLIAIEEKFSGTLDKSAIYPREIYKDVIKYNAKGIIISHNHPSGNTTPSKNDIKITEEIAKGLASFDAVLIEHIIITDNSYFSFLEEGLI